MKVWRTEKSIEMTATPEAVWRAWADVERWPAWNADIEHIVLAGPFATGSTITMTPHGAEPVALRVAEAREPHVFVDQADVAGTVIRTTHRVDDIGGGRAVVVYALEASGPAAEDLGPAISADFDDTLRALSHYIASGAPAEPLQSESSA